MRKKPKKTMFFLRILKLIQKKRHKKARRVLRKSAIKAFIQAHTGLWWCLAYIAPAIITILFVMLILIAAVILGVRFSSETNFIFTIVIGGGIIFILFYEIIKGIIQQWFKK